jgi:flagellar biosynthetic protein FliR
MDLNALVALVLVLVRVACVLACLPLVGEGFAPQAVKVLVALTVSIVLVAGGAATPPAEGWGVGQFFLFVGAEAFFGVLIGLSALLIFKSLRMGGELMGQEMGMALASIADPLSGEQTNMVGGFCEVVGSVVFFAVGGHIWMLNALRESFALWPLGAFVSPEFAHRVTLAATTRSFVMALQLASPLLLLTFLVSLTMAIMARLVPEMNILIVGFPLRVGVGLIGLVLFVPLLARYGAEVSRMMTTFLAGAAAGA